MFTTRMLAYTVAAMLALAAGHGIGQPKKDKSDSPPIPPEAEAMKEKRTRAHALLDALTAGDHDALRRHAEVLAAIAEMRVFASAYKTDEYQFQAQVFKHAADDLMTAAKAKNLDGAALAYADMARTCVKCHTHFRGVKK